MYSTYTFYIYDNLSIYVYIYLYIYIYIPGSFFYMRFLYMQTCVFFTCVGPSFFDMRQCTGSVHFSQYKRTKSSNERLVYTSQPNKANKTDEIVKRQISLHFSNNKSQMFICKKTRPPKNLSIYRTDRCDSRSAPRMS